MPAKRRSTTSTRRSSASSRETPNFFDRLEWRTIGPFRGGRVAAVAGDPRERNTFYFGSTGGGVWKTTDGGAVLGERDRRVLQARVGRRDRRRAVGSERHLRRDGREPHPRQRLARRRRLQVDRRGRTWRHIGLADTRHIGKVRVHPTNPDIVYVAALGHAHGPNPERGVYRSKDGGKTWEQVLYRSERAGAVDLVDRSEQPAHHLRRRSGRRSAARTGSDRSGGPGSGLLRSTDGGDTWRDHRATRAARRAARQDRRVARRPRGRGRVYAIVEAEDGGVFRSDDFGETWERGSEARNLRQRA